MTGDDDTAAPADDAASPLSTRAMAILWPSFLMAGVLEMLVFSVVDPQALRWFGSREIDMAPAGIYTLAFFVFWIVISTAGALTDLLEHPAHSLRDYGRSLGRDA